MIVADFIGQQQAKLCTDCLEKPFGLILTTMTFTPVSYITPAREIITSSSGIFFDAKLLKEAESRRRLLAAGSMVARIIALARRQQVQRAPRSDQP